MNSHILHGSESLCKLLRYLAEQTLDHPGSSVKEYQIATEVFGRPADFDPHMDSTVRVQAGRLRMKLGEYYNGEGAGDPLVVELPKGSYALSFRHRETISSAPHDWGQKQKQDAAIAAEKKSRFGFWILVGFLALALVALATVLTRDYVRPTVAHEAIPAAYKVFWRPFVSRPEEALVVFSNAAFVGRPETGMRYLKAGDSGDNLTQDHYTGVGEVLAVHELDNVFRTLHRNLRVKRGTLFSLDDAKNTDLIFVGSPAENLTLLEIPGTQQFVFQRVSAGARAGDLAVANLHPQADEPKMYLPSSPKEVLTEDYAVIGLVRGINPERPVLILAGTTTLGTQAAVEYVCHEDSLEDLLSRLSAPENGELAPFEAVLHVKVARGVPVKTDIVALRRDLP